MEDDDDDFYGEASPPAQPAHQLAVQDLLSRDNSTPKATLSAVAPQNNQQPSGLRQDVSMNDATNGDAGSGDEDAEEEEIEVEVEEDEDDVEFIFELKPGQAAVAPPQARYVTRTASAPVQPQRQPSSQDLKEPATASSASPAPRVAVLSAAKTQVPRGPTPPPMATSTLDINAVPVHPSTGEKLTSLNIDELPSKPWRNAGSDVTDYFNYGFDEFTWTAYCQKQENTRKDFDPKKMMEDMMMFGNMLDPASLSMMGMSGGAQGGNAGNMPNIGAAGIPSGMPIPPGMPPEMAAMMQQAGMPGMPGMPNMQGMPQMPGMPGFGMDMMGGAVGNQGNRQDMSQMFNQGGQSGFGPQNMNQFQQQGGGGGGSFAEEQQRFEQQKYMHQQRMQQQQRGFNNPNSAYGTYQNPSAGNQMGRGRGGPGVQGGTGGNVSQQRGW